MLSERDVYVCDYFDELISKIFDLHYVRECYHDFIVSTLVEKFAPSLPVNEHEIWGSVEGVFVIRLLAAMWIDILLISLRVCIHFNVLFKCPLCMEPLEMDDSNFFPCTCGYQVSIA